MESNQLRLEKREQAFGRVVLPGSKSISNRYLLLSALADGETEIINLLESDDTERMKEALVTLGVSWRKEEERYFIKGSSGSFPNREGELFLGNAGTAFRSLTAALAFNGGNYQLRGIPRMHERPIGDLVDALQMMGADIQYDGDEGYPPLTIRPATITNDKVMVKGSVSSQYLTALLMALPMLNQRSTLQIDGPLISKPYIDITLKALAQFGITVEEQADQTYIIPKEATYRSPGRLVVEGDASSASYFLAAGALAGDVTVEGIGRSSIQGDKAFATVLEQMGAIVEWREESIRVKKPNEPLKGINLDCNDIPDAAMTLATMALFCQGPTHLRNIGSWRVKETDRIEAMVTELRKLGATVEAGSDWITVAPLAEIRPNQLIKTYDDHRIAMCFSLCAFKGALQIHDPACVNKTVPEYFDLFNEITLPKE